MALDREIGTAGVREDGNVVDIADTASRDAFSRIRVSDPVALFSSQCQYDAEPLLYEAGNTGTGTSAPAHSADTRMVAFTATAGTGTEFFQSYEYIPYQAGKSQLALITGVLGAPVAGAVVEVGLFDAVNGIFLRQNGTVGLQIVRRSSTSGSVVEDAISQDSWNVDRFDGSGPSGITLDQTRAFILVIDGQFLGMGRVRVGFDVGGRIAYAHEFLNANVLAVPYMQTLSLPVQVLLTTTATATTKTCAFKCASVSSEGGFADDLGYSFVTPEQTVSAVSATRTHLISLRPAAMLNSITNRARMRLDSVELLVTGNSPVLWELCIGSTFSVAPTYAAVNATHSAAESSSAVGTLTAAGVVIAAGYCSATATSKASISARSTSARYPISLSRAGAARANGTLSLIVSGIGGASACRAAFDFTEIR